MARSASTAGGLIGAKVAAAAAGVSAGTPITQAQLDAIWTALSAGLYQHDASAAVVSVAQVVAPSGGGPVTGTGGPIT